jgi:aspartyl/asparaginyl-tRNA synthetase
MNIKNYLLLLCYYSSKKVKFCTSYVLENCADELAYFEDEYPAGEKGLRARLRNAVENDFATITYTAAIELLQRDIAAGKKFERLLLTYLYIYSIDYIKLYFLNKYTMYVVYVRTEGIHLGATI